MSKIFVQLKGGLGNQMFQYAMARSLAIKNGSDLILDHKSGFARDFMYKRTYELDFFPIVSKKANTFNLISIWFYRIIKKFFNSDFKRFDKHFYGYFINENSYKFLEDVRDFKFSGRIWLLGYWQSPYYFVEHSSMIRKELKPPESQQKIFLDMAERIINTESIALGIRLYEESSNPGEHSSTGELKSISSIKLGLDTLISKKPNSVIYVFCTHRSPLLEKLELPENVVYVTHDDGFLGAVDRLWLISKCKHHIFTNSSFYWWGAWLSSEYYKEQLIFAADNFINSDSLLKEWKSF